jgi:hypothetical protein
LINGSTYQQIFQDSLGNTPIHLAVVQMPTPWDPILDLMEAGGKILTRNSRGISPVDLLPPIVRLQKQLVADCWLGLVLEDAAHTTEHSEQGRSYLLYYIFLIAFFPSLQPPINSAA